MTWDRQETYWSRVRSRLCVDCGAGLQELDGRRCVECAERALTSAKRYRKSSKGLITAAAWQRAEYWRYPEAFRRAAAERRQARKEAGTCADCPEPAAEDSNLCPMHRDVRRGRTRLSMRALRQRRALEATT